MNGLAALVAAVALAAPLRFETLAEGSGPAAKVGTRVTVHFVVTAPDGSVVADSERRGLPFTFVVGEAPTMPLWERVVPWMRVGGTRRAVATPDLVAGPDGNLPAVPGDLPLTVTVTLIAVKD